MSVSLINHSRGYSLSGVELCVNIVFLGSGMLYGRRHLQLADRPGASQWQRVIGYIEYFPLLGGIVALIEYALFRCGCFKRSADPSLVHQNNMQNPLTIDPLLETTPFSQRLISQENDIRPFGQPRRCPWVEDLVLEDHFFESLQYVSTGEEFVVGLRRALPPFMDGRKRITWADVTVYDRPALYWAIFWQNLPFIESVVQSNEGAKLLNRSYPVRTASLVQTATAVERPGLEDLVEYPINQAVRMAVYKRNFPTVEAAVQADQVATRIVLRLLELKANINQVDGSGRTPLHLALIGGNFALVKLLIQKGGTAQLSATTHEIRTPEDPEYPLDLVPLRGMPMHPYVNDLDKPISFITTQTNVIFRVFAERFCDLRKKLAFKTCLTNQEFRALAQLYHDLDEEMNQEIIGSTPLILDLSTLVLRYLY